MTDLLAIVLPSGVGVRFRDLTPSEGDKVLLAAGHSLNADSTQADLEMAELREGLGVMIDSVLPVGSGKTKKVAVPLLGPKEPYVLALEAALREAAPEVAAKLVKQVPTREVEELDLNHPDNGWQKLDPDVPGAYDTAFSNRDHSALKQIYHARNRVFRSEVDAILGKAVTVARK